MRKNFQYKSIFFLLSLFLLFGQYLLSLLYNQERSQNLRLKVEKVFEFSLEDCILKAIKNNLSLKAEMLTPEIADWNVTMAVERFLPSLSLIYNDQNTREASYSFS